MSGPAASSSSTHSADAHPVGPLGSAGRSAGLPVYERRPGAPGADAGRPGPLWTEWLLTNGMGGFAMGTVLGVPTRRYHGLLIAPLRPPLERVLALSGFVEKLTLRPAGGEPVVAYLSLHHFVTAGDRPIASPYLVRFEKDLECRWLYRVPAGGPTGGVEVQRTVHLYERRSAVAVRYAVSAAGVPWELELRPLVALRDFHEVCSGADVAKIRVRSLSAEDGSPGMMAVAGSAGVYLTGTGVSAARAEPEPWEGVEYLWEERRGLAAAEDLCSAGAFVAAGDGRRAHEVVITASADAMPTEPIADDRAHRAERVAGLVRAAQERAPEGDSHARRTIAALTAAADDFVVRRGTAHDGRPGSTVIAGYPWFGDWGRDTMICLPGLLLETGRHDEALRVLLTFARARRRGLIPNRFDDYSGPAHYNTVDAPLWFVHACCRYLRATGDREHFSAELLPACEDVVQFYKGGTDYGIGADPRDGLVRAGTADTQLTWMDAKRDGVCFTPRFGKAVEINALWYNALASLSEAIRPDFAALSAELATMAEAVGRSFRKAFTGGPRGGLVDCVTPDPRGGWFPSDELRCNQIFAVSLPHSPLGPEDRRRVVAVVRERLLTPVGLRTLEPGARGYRARFEGDLFSRDGAYHNGTVWPWLLGPYCEALLRSENFSEQSRAQARRLLDGLADRLDECCVGQLAEVYDADEPRRPDGCPAQAWSVAETLRVLKLAVGSRG